MKKIFIPYLLLLSIVVFALPQKRKVKKARQKEPVTKVEYETFTRGNSTVVTVTRDSAISIGRSEKKYILVTASHWKEICTALKSVTLSSIPTLEAPTKAREYDGAAHSKITLSTSGQTYETKYFDSGQPMKQLQSLYDVIQTIRTGINNEGKTYTK